MKSSPKKCIKKIAFSTTLLFSLIAGAYAQPQLVNINNAIPNLKNTLPNINGSPDAVIPNYTAEIKNPAKKTITIINNTQQTIYPVARVYNLSDLHEYRIYVGQSNGGNLSLGIPGKNSGNNKATITIPSPMWNAGRVELFNVAPPIPNTADGSTIAAIDQNPESTNIGDLIYTNKVANGFSLDAASQLVEYTFETPQNVVDYDISYVDHLYMPVAIEADTGTIGYMGNGMSFEDMQNQIKRLADGSLTTGYFVNKQKIGWPLFYNPSIQGVYAKLPAAFNTFALNDARSTFDQQKDMLVTDNVNTTDHTIINSIANRWLGWVKDYNGDLPQGPVTHAGAYAANCKADSFCNKFADTVTRIWHAAQKQDPTYTPVQIVEKILGYTYPANFNADNPIYPDSKDPQNSFRDAVKSVLRGVPYPFWDYPQSQWYPNPSATVNGKANPNQKYNLDPIVWFVHHQLGMAGYGFSIDDDTGNVETPGTSFTIAVGGLDGLKIKTQYNPDTQQAVLLAKGWKGLESTNLGNCELVPNNGTDCPVNLTPARAPEDRKATVTLSSDGGKLSFALTYADQLPNGVYPLKMTDCTVSGNINKNMCTSGVLKVDSMKQQFFIVPPPDTSSSNGNGGNPTPPVTPKSYLYLPNGWKSIVGCGIDAADNQGKAWGPGFNNNNQNQCTVQIQDMDGKKASLDIQFNTDGQTIGGKCLLSDGTTPCKVGLTVSPAAVNLPTPSDVFHS